MTGPAEERRSLRQRLAAYAAEPEGRLRLTALWLVATTCLASAASLAGTPEGPMALLVSAGMLLAGFGTIAGSIVLFDLCRIALKRRRQGEKWVLGTLGGWLAALCWGLAAFSALLVAAYVGVSLTS